MLTISNDPLPALFEVIQEMYPHIQSDIQYDPTLNPYGEGEGKECGYATQLDDGTWAISISSIIPVFAVPEIVAHEIAHIVVGFDQEHNEVWETAFKAIHTRHTERIIETAKKNGTDVCYGDGLGIYAEYPEE